MSYNAKHSHDEIIWYDDTLDIITGHDNETGAFYCDIVYHKTDVGIMGVRGEGFKFMGLTEAQLEIMMEKYAQAYVLGYKKALEDKE